MIDYCDLLFRFIDWFSYYFDLLIDLHSNRLLWWLFRLVWLTFSGLIATYNKLVHPESRSLQHGSWALLQTCPPLQNLILWKYLLFVLLDFVYCLSFQSLTYSLPQIAWYWNFTHDMISSFQFIWTPRNNKYQRNPVINFESRFRNSSAVVLLFNKLFKISKVKVGQNQREPLKI